ncbi:hypothetical protein HK105_203038 [Polyrhizophydium stewartii]|uniref:Uncharacterized protein n=1 Tax=Polyrhizophydium stewartii TaxID=2732419 RepID=A0ABR4ND61_9FUNG|nr:hypothetical protein HK105_000276 [Polyrhizophydium stewartii]
MIPQSAYINVAPAAQAPAAGHPNQQRSSTRTPAAAKAGPPAANQKPKSWGSVLGLGQSLSVSSSRDAGLPLTRERAPHEPSGLVRPDAPASHGPVGKVCSAVGSVGSSVWTGIDYVSNAVADFLGITSPRYELWIEDARSFQTQLAKERTSQYETIECEPYPSVAPPSLDPQSAISHTQPAQDYSIRMG